MAAHSKQLKRLQAALLTAFLPSFSYVSLAADYTQVVVPDGDINHITLQPGDTIRYIGNEGAITVTGANASVTADGIRIVAGDPDTPRAPSKGVLVKAGGSATISNSSIDSTSLNQNAHALSATGKGSIIHASDMDLRTSALNSYAANAQAGGQIILQGATITTNVTYADGLHATGAGSKVSADNVKMTNVAYPSRAERGGVIEMNNSHIELTGGV